MPDRTFLYSGHMLDTPTRERPRFPPALEPSVRASIHRELDALDAAAGERVVGSGACGSDILFAEAFVERGLALHLYLPFAEPEFLHRSVAFAGTDWISRYRTIAGQARVVCIADEVLGPLPAGADAFERTNEWMLAEALRIGGQDLTFVCVWDGEGGDGPGGTRHMVECVRQSGGTVRRIDLRGLQ